MATIPSIAMIPSGYKAGKLYSVLPTNGDGDFTTTRNTVATRLNENGLLEEVAANVPRLDYSDGSCPSLLLEGTATNLITYSENFSDASWIKSNSSVVSGFTSPSGDVSAFKLVEGASNSQHRIKANFTAVTNNTVSVFVKQNTKSKILLFNGNAGYGFDLANSTTSAVAGVNAPDSFNIESYGNGWYRCSISHSSANSIEVYLLNDFITTYVYQGDGTSGVYIYGAQIEENSHATSYIKTVGSQQTRSADTATGSVNSTVINSSQGVLYFEGSYPITANGSGNKRISISDGTSGNRVMLAEVGNTGISALISSGGLNSAYITGSLDNLSNFKIAISYKQNDFALWVNGIKTVGVPTNGGNAPIGLNQVAFDGGDGTNPFYGKTKSVQVYTSALSDLELTNLTKI